MKKVWTRKELAILLIRNDVFVGRCLVKLLDRQTSEEQMLYTSSEKNNRGFDIIDAPLLTSFAKQYLHKEWLSSKQLYRAREKLPKYLGQLLQEANKDASA